MASVSSLIGRHRELSDVLKSVEAGASTRGAVVVGEAGIGKSRLTQGATRAIRDRGGIVATGVCLPRSRAIPMLPFLDMLRAIDAAGVLRPALNDCPSFVRREMSRLLPELGRASGGNRDMTATSLVDRRLPLFDATRLLLSAVDARQHLILVLEDVHWAASTTLELTEYLVATSHPTASMIFTCRPESVDADWLEAVVIRGGLRRVELGPLSRGETADQITMLAGSAVTPRRADDIFQRTAGHPLFVEQLISATADGSALSLPSGLRSLLLNRVTAVAAPERHLLDLLAVADRPLDDDSLSYAAAVPTERVDSALVDLTHRRLTVNAPDGFALRHSLLAEALRSDLPPWSGRQLHLTVAHTLAWRFGNSLAGEIAEHAQAAGDGDLELGWRVPAARRALELLAPDQATTQWNRVLELWRTQPDPASRTGMSLAQVQVETATSLEHAGNVADAEKVIDDALRLPRDAMPDPQWAWLLYLAGFLRSLSSSTEGEPLLRRACDAYESLPASPEKARALHRLSRLLRNRRSVGDDEQHTLLIQALDVSRACVSPAVERMVLAALADLSLSRGDLLTGRQQATAVLQLPPSDDDVLASLAGAGMASGALLRSGAFKQVVSATRAELAWAQEHVAPTAYGALVLRANLAMALQELGRVEESSHALRDAPDRDERHATLIPRAYLAYLNGDLDAALRMWHSYEPPPFSRLSFLREDAVYGIEIEMCAGSTRQAAQFGLDVLGEVAPTDWSQFSGLMIMLTARACADLATSETHRHNPGGAQEARQLGQRLTDTLERFRNDPFGTPPPSLSTSAQHLETNAELERLVGTNHAARWEAVSAAWQKTDQPHRLAYALYRQADALLASPSGRADAAPVLRGAAELANGHVPLHTRITDLAARAHTKLQPPEPDEAATPPETTSAPFGLTVRELAVLREIGAGHTNAEIGQRLFISRSTAGVHVSNILRKLDVRSRVQAAAVASTLGILETDPTRTAVRQMPTS